MEDYFDYHANAALEELGERTGAEVAKTHALLAIAYAIRATTHEATPQDTPTPRNPRNKVGFPHFNQAMR